MVRLNGRRAPYPVTRRSSRSVQPFKLARRLRRSPRSTLDDLLDLDGGALKGLPVRAGFAYLTRHAARGFATRYGR